jgi:HSP20 family protein
MEETMRTLTPFNLLNEMDSLLNSMTPSITRTYDERSFDPPCDVTEGDDHFLMSFDLPGVRKEDLKIEASGNLLTISGEKRREWPSQESHKTQRYERAYGFFKRSFTLPTNIESSSIEAQFKDGVLSLYLPKVAAAKTRHIEIKSGEGGFFSKLLDSKNHT